MLAWASTMQKIGHWEVIGLNPFADQQGKLDEF